MATPSKFSRHVNEQHRWTEALIARLSDNLSCARSFKMTQADYNARCDRIMDARKGRLTRDSAAYVAGYMRARFDALLRELIHVRRIVGRPETATAAKWQDMTEEMRDACRNHNTESALCWDDKGAHPFGEWSKE